MTPNVIDELLNFVYLQNSNRMHYKILVGIISHQHPMSLCMHFLVLRPLRRREGERRIKGAAARNTCLFIFFKKLKNGMHKEYYEIPLLILMAAER